MGVLISGVAVLAATLGAFAYCLPRGGRPRRFVGTALEPYVAVAFCTGFALGFTMILSSILDLMS
jgi:hypothetical protein